MRVLLLNDSTTYPNWGGRAATISLRLMIREVGGEIIKSVMIETIPLLEEVAGFRIVG